MLDLMRKHAGTWLVKVILGAIIIVFTFWGVGSYRMRQGTQVAVVNGSIVTVEQYQAAYNRILEGLRQRFGNNLNDDMLKLFNVRQQALDSIVDQSLMLGEAKRLQFRVSDDELSAAIRNIPAFQNNGNFDKRLYQRVLDANRLTPESFEAQQRDAMLIQKLQSFVTGSVKVSEAETRQWYNWNDASVDVEYTLIEPKRYKDIQPAPEEVAAYWEENKSSYKDEPLVKARYIAFTPESFIEQASVSEEEIQDYYEAHPEEFAKPKTVEARHILFKIGDADTPENVEATRNKALDVLKQIQDGADFAEMAKQFSEGPSKATGGYLGAFRREAMVAPFSEKAFSMEAGQVSEPVRTQFGWHIIKVEKINAAETDTLDVAQSGIREKLALDAAKNLAFDKAEAVYDATYGQDDLSTVAAEQDLEVQTTELFTRKGPGEVVKNPGEFAEAAFNLKVDEISDVKDVGGVYYIIQVTEEVPEKISEFAAVNGRVTADLTAKQQKDKASEDAKTLLAAVKGGQTLADAGNAFDVAPATTGWFKRQGAIPGIGSDPALTQAAFKLSTDAPLPEDVIKGAKGDYVIRLKDRKLPDEAEFNNQAPLIEVRLMRQKEMGAYTALLETLKGKSEITFSDGYGEQ